MELPDFTFLIFDNIKYTYSSIPSERRVVQAYEWLERSVRQERWLDLQGV